MNLLAKKIKPRDIVTKKALENAATIVAATGGSTNAACIYQLLLMKLELNLI